MAAEVSDPRAPDLRGLGIMQLLKQASRRRGSSTSAAAGTTAGATTNAGLEVALARLAGSGMTLHTRALQLGCHSGCISFMHSHMPWCVSPSTQAAV